MSNCDSDGLMDEGDTQLAELQKDLHNSIDKAKTIFESCNYDAEPQNTHFELTSNGDLIYPQFNTEKDYHSEFWQLYLKNELHINLIKEITQRTNQLAKLTEIIQTKHEQYSKLYKLKNRKKNRRLASQIEKNFECPYENCYKIYGSDVSLNLHIKLKHNGGNKTDRQKLAEQICIARAKGLQQPPMRFNLPPGFLQVRCIRLSFLYTFFRILPSIFRTRKNNKFLKTDLSLLFLFLHFFFIQERKVYSNNHHFVFKKS